MNNKHEQRLERNNFHAKETNNFPLKRAWKAVSKTAICQWCHSPEIKLVPINFLLNLKPREAKRYQKVWRQRGWPTKLFLCWFCRQNCELSHQRINCWLCPQCHKCLVYQQESKPRKPAHEQLPASCFQCGWQKKRLSKQERVKMTDQAIKSGLSYQLGKESTQKNYFAWCSFCQGVIEGQQKNKLVLNRNQLRFWTDKVSEERLICNPCLRESREFQKLLPSKYRGRWWAYKCREMI